MDWPTRSTPSATPSRLGEAEREHLFDLIRASDRALCGLVRLLSMRSEDFRVLWASNDA